MDPSRIHEQSGLGQSVSVSKSGRGSLPTYLRVGEHDVLSCRDLEALAYLNDEIVLIDKKVQPIRAL